MQWNLCTAASVDWNQCWNTINLNVLVIQGCMQAINIMNMCVNVVFIKGVS